MYNLTIILNVHSIHLKRRYIKSKYIFHNKNYPQIINKILITKVKFYKN